jgi:hypothetical protein
MIDYRTLRMASGPAVNNHAHSLIVAQRGRVLTDDLDFPRRPAGRARVTVVSGSATYGPRSMIIDAADSAEIESPLTVVARIEDVLRSVAGPLVVLAAALALAITVSITPAPDLPGPVAGPLSGHSVLHFPR